MILDKEKIPPNIKSYRKEIRGAVGAAGNIDAQYTINQLIADTPVTFDNIIAVCPEGVRAETSWAEFTGLIYYNKASNVWGIHNIQGTGGYFIADFVLLYDANK